MNQPRVTPPQIAAGLRKLLAAGIPRPWDVESPEAMIEAYSEALDGVDMIGFDRAIRRVLQTAKKFPTAGALRELAWELRTPATVTGESPCGKPGCTCGGFEYYLRGARDGYLSVSHLPRHEGDGRLTPVKEAYCPDANCECVAVEVYDPSPDGPLAGLRTLSRLRPRVWVWRHILERDSLQPVPEAERA